MQRAPDAVTGQVADDLKPAGRRRALHGQPDGVELRSGAHHRQRLRQCVLRATSQTLGLVGDRRHGDGCGGIAIITVQHRGHVDIDEVAFLDHPVVGDAVRGDVVQADAGCAGEVVHHLRGGARAVAGKRRRAHLVQFGGRDAGADVGAHLTERQRNNPPDLLQTGKVLFALNRHGVVLFADRYSGQSLPQVGTGGNLPPYRSSPSERRRLLASRLETVLPSGWRRGVSRRGAGSCGFGWRGAEGAAGSAGGGTARGAASSSRLARSFTSSREPTRDVPRSTGCACCRPIPSHATSRARSERVSTSRRTAISNGSRITAKSSSHGHTGCEARSARRSCTKMSAGSSTTLPPVSPAMYSR